MTFKLVELNCQNFECDSNKGGDCLQGNVQMRPVTEKGLQIDRLICVQATKEEESRHDGARKVFEANYGGKKSADEERSSAPAVGNGGETDK